MEKLNEYSLLELSEKSGIPPRTIRYYISKTLLMGPAEVGRNAVYTDNHLARLEEIQVLKQKGMSLHAISVDSQKPDVHLTEPTAWIEYSLEDDITVSIRTDISPWRMNLIKKTLNSILPQIKKNGDER